MITTELVVFVLRLFGIMAGLIVLLTYIVEGREGTEQAPWVVPWGLGRFALVLLAWWVLYLAIVGNASSLLANGNRLAGGALSEAVLSLLGYLLGVGLPTLVVLYLLVWRPFAGRLGRLFQSQLVKGWLQEGIGGYLVTLPFLTLPWVMHLAGAARSTATLEILMAAIPQAPSDQAISLFSVAIVAPIVEEMMFRGFVYASLASWQDWRVALIFSSSLFALAHRNVYEFWPLFVMGVACGLVYERTRSLASCVLLHSISNLATFGTLWLLGS